MIHMKGEFNYYSCRAEKGWGLEFDEEEDPLKGEVSINVKKAGVSIIVINQNKVIQNNRLICVLFKQHTNNIIWILKSQH